MAEKQSQQAQERSQMQKPEGGQAQAQGAQGRQPERGIQRRGPFGTLGRMGGYGGSPFSMMRRMMDDMDRMFEDFGFGGMSRQLSPITGGGIGGGTMEVFSPAIEVVEREGKLIVRADLPGMKREDIRVNVDEDGLLLEGERKSEREESREGYYASERTYGSFQRRIPLPRGIDPQKCDASFENGVLEVSLELPKESRRKIEVRSGGGGAGTAPSTVKH